MDDPLGIGKLNENSAEIIKLIYHDLAQPAVQKVGYALGATLDCITIPFKYLSLFAKEADVRINKRLNEYASKLEEYNEEDIGVAPPEIGVPIIEELTRVTNDELAELYVNLLVKASLIENSKYAHPSFINVLKSLSGDEAKIINYLSNMNEDEYGIMFIEFGKTNFSGESFIPLSDKENNIDELVELEFPDNKIFYITNLTTQGIIDSLNAHPVTKKDSYKEFERKLQPEIEEIKQVISNSNKEKRTRDQDKFFAQWGIHRLTRFGEAFIKSINYRNN